MRFFSLLGYSVSLAAIGQLAVSSPLGDPNEPEIIAVAEFPESNAFHHVVNGERNAVMVTIENKSDRNVTLNGITGSLSKPDSGKVVKNMTAVPFNVPFLEGAKIQIPYTFHSEFKPGDYRLNIWVEHSLDDVKYRAMAYDSIVAIVEPSGSWFDFRLWITYAIVTALLGGVGYYTYISFVPQPKKRRAPQVSAPVTVTATGAGGYSEEWIPEHHLKKPKVRKTKSGTATSADETSGPEASGAEGKKRKARK